MPVLRIQALWTGFPGAPGYSNFHFSVPDAVPSAAVVNGAAAAVRTMFSAVGSLMPNSVTIAVKPTADIYDVTGPKIAEVPVTTPGTAVAGSVAGNYAAGVGAVINWRTGAYWRGRQVSGRTFLVPVSNGYSADGTLSAAGQTLILNAANAYRGTSNPIPVVWQVHQHGVDGGTTPITGATVPDRPAVLRSRR